MIVDVKPPSFYEIAYRDLKFQFGNKYAELFKDAIREQDSVSVVRYHSNPLCPYCFGNPNYRACGQCDGHGEVKQLNFSESAGFIGVIPLSSQD